MENTDIKQQIIALWKQGYSIPQIEEELFIRIKLSTSTSIRESLESGDYMITERQLLID